jgi:hypothetical protein
LIGHRRSSRGRFAALALVALAFRAVIPIGFMPAAAGLELCHGGFAPAVESARLPQHGDPGAPPAPHAHAEGCVFAASAAGLAPPAAAPAIVDTPTSRTRIEVPATASHAFPPLRRAHSPRGPPMLS